MRTLAAERGVKSTVIALGVDVEQFPPVSPRARDPSQPLRLVHVASLNGVKDQSTLLGALSILKRRGQAFEMRVIGFDTLAGEIQRQSAALDLAEEVRFLGVLDHRRLFAQYQWADMLVMSSRHEAGPIVMLEAALGGVPTVGTHVGHIADHSPRAALAVPVADPTNLAEAVEHLARDDAGRIAMAQAAQAFALERDAAFTANAFLALYRNIIDRRR